MCAKRKRVREGVEGGLKGLSTALGDGPKEI